MHSIRKPRVFLSHSKKDVEFIRRLDADLRASQCDTWIDDIELRSGQPWLDQIFGSGIPSCEVVLCYITTNSIESSVFKQEMDARLLERLQNARVSLLLYVADPALRPKMRLDLQRLQMTELNEANYPQVFPRVVGEVWHCYAESLVLSSVEAERVKRLEAELRVKELESNASTTVFSASENAEFTIAWAQLDREIDVNIQVQRKNKTKPALAKLSDEPEPPTRHEFVLNVGAIFRLCVLSQKYEPSQYTVHDRIERDVLLYLDLQPDDFFVSADVQLDLDSKLLRYGFVERQYLPPSSNDDGLMRFVQNQNSFKLMFTPKFDRFGFWIEHNFGSIDELALVVRAH